MWHSSSKNEISTTTQADTTTIVESKAVETRKGVGRETDTMRQIKTETGSVTKTLEIGTVTATETDSTGEHNEQTGYESYENE